MSTTTTASPPPSLPTANTALTVHDRLRLSTAEKRIRNRSLCSLLWTPPLYPGYSAKLEKSTRTSLSQPQWRVATSEIAISSNPISPNPSASTTTRFYLSPTGNGTETTDVFKRDITSQLQASESGEISWNSPKKYTYSKESSGYGSGTSESDPENEHQSKKTLHPLEGTTNEHGHSSSTVVEQEQIGVMGRTTKRAQTRQQRHRHLADTGIRRPIVREQSINRPESVLQLARKFAEASAAQDKRIYISNQKLLANGENLATTNYSRSGPNSPVRQGKGTDHPILLDTINKKPGGIACLYNGQMSKVNVFKQMDQMHRASQPQPARPLNPSSIKNALLRWCQYKLQDYPIQINNFSSAWADGMAFCALIHRFAPHAFDFNKLNPRNRRENLELAFRVAEQNGIVPLLEVEDMLIMGDRPDWKCIFTYVQSFYKEFKDRP